MNLSELTPASIGAGVVYKPENRQGHITSFNNRFVFVAFPNTVGRGQAARPEDLEFLQTTGIPNSGTKKTKGGL
jgi:hypothetical protein